MAANFGGFEAVSRMTWQEFALARQYLVEREIGTRLREAKAVEDAKAKRAKKELERKR